MTNHWRTRFGIRPVTRLKETHPLVVFFFYSFFLFFKRKQTVDPRAIHLKKAEGASGQGSPSQAPRVPATTRAASEVSGNLGAALGRPRRVSGRPLPALPFLLLVGPGWRGREWRQGGLRGAGDLREGWGLVGTPGGEWGGSLALRPPPLRRPPALPAAEVVGTT